MESGVFMFSLRLLLMMKPNNHRGSLAFAFSSLHGGWGRENFAATGVTCKWLTSLTCYLSSPALLHKESELCP